MYTKYLNSGVVRASLSSPGMTEDNTVFVWSGIKGNDCNLCTYDAYLVIVAKLKPMCFNIWIFNYYSDITRPANEKIICFVHRSQEIGHHHVMGVGVGHREKQQDQSGATGGRGSIRTSFNCGFHGEEQVRKGMQVWDWIISVGFGVQGLSFLVWYLPGPLVLGWLGQMDSDWECERVIKQRCGLWVD